MYGLNQFSNESFDKDTLILLIFVFRNSMEVSHELS